MQAMAMESMAPVAKDARSTEVEQTPRDGGTGDAEEEEPHCEKCYECTVSRWLTHCPRVPCQALLAPSQCL